MALEEDIEIINLIGDLEVGLTNKYVAILIALSDNSGYRSCELAEILDDYESNLSNYLGDLSSYKFGDVKDSLSIQPYHIQNPSLLASKIQTQRDPISKYIFENIPCAIKEKFNDPSLVIVAFHLAKALDSMLNDKRFFSGERFKKIHLSEKATQLLESKEKLNDQGIRFLNRILIWHAYPDEICETKICLTKKIFRNKVDGRGSPHVINPSPRAFIFIFDFLVNELDRDRREIKKLRGKINHKVRAYREYENLIKNDKIIKKPTKDSRDLVDCENSYKDNQDLLLKFLTSNYTGEYIKDHADQGLFDKIRKIEDFEYAKFLMILCKNDYINKNYCKKELFRYIHESIRDMKFGKSDPKLLNL